MEFQLPYSRLPSITHKINLNVTDGAEWEFYSDSACTKPVSKESAQTYIQTDAPYMLYIKLTKPDFVDAVYGLEITRREANVVDEPLLKTIQYQ